MNHRFAILLLLSQSPTGWLKSCKSWGAPRGWWSPVMFLGLYPMNTIFLQFYHVLSYYIIVISTINHRIQSLQVTGTSPVNLSSRCHAQFAAMVGVIVTSAFGTLYLERQLKASSKDRGTRRCGEGKTLGETSDFLVNPTIYLYFRSFGVAITWKKDGEMNQREFLKRPKWWLNQGSISRLSTRKKWGAYKQDTHNETGQNLCRTIGC